MPKKNLAKAENADKKEEDLLEEDSEDFEKDDYKDFLKEYHSDEDDSSDDSDSWAEEEAGELRDDDL